MYYYVWLRKLHARAVRADKALCVEQAKLMEQDEGYREGWLAAAVLLDTCRASQ